MEFNPPWNLIANRGEIRPNQSPAEGGARREIFTYQVMRDFVLKWGISRLHGDRPQNTRHFVIQGIKNI